MSDRGAATSKVSQDRLWQRLLDIAAIGAIDGDGSCRPALTDADRDARDQLALWCGELGYDLRVDQIGNQFARRAGRDPDAPPILIGSHLDTQPTGGRFDGVAGVLAALEVLQSLDDLGVETNMPVELVNWTNEEGARFQTGLTGSAVWSGQLSLAEAWADKDRDGKILRDELERIGYLGEDKAAAYPLCAFFELHIEQGPVLEDAGDWIGVVERIQNMGRVEAILHGTEAHAGTTPMDQRDDPIRALAAILPELYKLVDRTGPEVRFNVGTLIVEPGAINTVPGRVRLGIDLRHPDAVTHGELVETIRKIFADHGERLGLDITTELVWSSPGLDFDRAAVQLLQRAAARCGYPARLMVSGAGHDAMALARVAPAAMVFIPCRGGVSHNPAEWAEPEHLAAGAHVLLEAVLERGAVVD